MDLETQSRCVGELASMLLQTVQPGEGWTQATLEMKVVGDDVFYAMNTTEPSGNRAFAGQAEDGPASDLAKEFQRACYREGAGTWLSALVVAKPQGDDGQVNVDAFQNYDHEVQPFGDDDHAFTGPELAAFLEQYPREQGAIPPWMADRIAFEG